MQDDEMSQLVPGRSSYGLLSKCLNFIDPIDDLTYKKIQENIQGIGSTVLPSLIEGTVLMLGAASAGLHLEPGALWYQVPLLYSGLYLTQNILTRLCSIISNCTNDHIFLKDPNLEFSLRVHGVRLMRALLFALGDFPRNLLMHEAGHAVAASALYQNATPEMYIRGGYFFPQASYTNYSGNWSLTSFGERVGVNNSRTTLAAMGTGADIISILLELTLAQIASRRKYSEMALYIRASALLLIIADMAQAIDALNDNHCPDQSDYCEGLSPELMIGLLVGLTFSYQLILSISSCCRNNVEEAYILVNDDSETNSIHKP